MRDLNILLTAVGGPGAPGIAWALRDNGERKIRLIGCDVDNQAGGFTLMDACYQVPRGTEPGYVERILEIAQTERIDAIVPLATMELPALSAARAEFERIGSKVTVMGPDVLDTANDKGALYGFLESNGLACAPQYRSVRNACELESAARALGYPDARLVVKPAFAGGSRGLRILSNGIESPETYLTMKPEAGLTNLENLCRTLSKASSFPHLVVMEYLPGKEYSVDILGREGDAIAIIPRSRDRLSQGICVRGQVENRQELIDLATQLCRLLRLSFAANMQFRYGDKGVPKLLEINVRLPGTVILSVAAGVNLPYLAVKMAIGEPLPSFEIRWGTRMVRSWRETFYDPNGHAYSL